MTNKKKAKSSSKQKASSSTTSSERSESPLYEAEQRSLDDQIQPQVEDAPIMIESPQPDDEPLQDHENKLDGVTIVNDTLSLLQEHRKEDITQILGSLDLDSEGKQTLTEIFHQLGWIGSPEDYAHTVFVAALNNEWEIAKYLVSKMDTQDKVFWMILRKLIANWNVFRDRRQLRELCVLVMQADPKAMPTLNEWARNKGKEQNIVIKGYCDLCQGESKLFAMNYSEL